MFDEFFEILAGILNFFYTLVPESLRDDVGFGLAIMGLTVLVMVVITPLTIKSTRSMIQMQRLQPEMKRIQEKYKDDREKLNQELMAFYREHQINPLGGCLPLLAQMPVFIIMYQLLRGLTVRDGGVGTGIGQTLAREAQGLGFEPWIFTDQPFRPQHLGDSPLGEALRGQHQMNFLGMDLSMSASEAVTIGIVTAIPFLFLLLIMLGTGLYQNRQMQARNTSKNANPQQQMIMKIMPFFLPVFSFAFPAGLALYWCTQNFCRIGTNAYITRSLYKKEHEHDAIETTATERTSTAKKGAGAKGSPTSKGSTSKGSSDSPKTPGRSVKSQMAHKKTSGRSSTGGTSSGANGRAGVQVNPRRSGESRRRPDQKKK